MEFATETLKERFIRYVKINTTAKEGTGQIPSFEGQRVLAELLKEELLQLGISDAEVTKDCFVFGTIPPTPGYEHVKTLGLLAHLDTAPDCDGEHVNPQIHKNYDGGVLALKDGITIDPAQHPELLRYVGHELITSDGTTLLGADDKSGIAIIMTAVELLMGAEAFQKIPHGKIRIAFTPDEEISPGGVTRFDVKAFGADFGLTVDGDGLGELNYETFNGLSATVTIRGRNIHPAEAKGKMINACSLALEFDRLLPESQRPELTEGYEGFFHMCELSGTVEDAKIEYIVRDFEKTGLEEKKEHLQWAATALNQRYGDNTVTLSTVHEYSNPKDAILNCGDFLDTCKNAFTCCAIQPKITPIRGGTDGSTLGDMGLPCPNLFLSGHNYHSVREFVSVDGMGKSAEVVLKIIELLAR